MNCPERWLISEDARLVLSDPDRARIERHLTQCVECRTVAAEERRWAELGGLVCPEAERLAAFVDERLPVPAMERTAAHVLVCDPCRDVVAWTREAERESTRVRRRRTGRRRKVTRRQEVAWWPAAAAVAAALALGVAFLLTPSGVAPTPSTMPDQVALAPEPTAPTPGPTASTTPAPEAVDATPTAQPAGPEPVDLEPIPEPTPVEGAEVATPEPANPEPAQPTPDTSTTPERPAEVQVAAVPGGAASGLAMLTPSGWQPVGPGLVDGARVQAQGGPVLLSIGGADWHLRQRAEVTVRGDHLELHGGALLLDAGDHQQAEVRSGGATVQAAAEGAQVSLEAGSGSLVVLVTHGVARLQVGDVAIDVTAGEGRRVRGGRVQTLRGPALSDALLAATEAAQEAGADVPRGLVLRSAVEAAARDLAGGAPVERASAIWTIAGLAGADARTARIARPHLVAAVAAARTLTTQSATLPPSAAARLALALRAPALRRAASLDPEPMEQALRADPAAVAKDTWAQLALRRSSQRAPRAFWKAVLAERSASPAAGDAVGSARSMAQAILCGATFGAKARAVALADIDVLLAQEPAKTSLASGALADLALALGAGKALDASRAQRLLLHAVGAPRASALALAVAPEAFGLTAAPAAAEPASAVALRVGQAYRVTLRVRAPAGARTVTLCATWNGWNDAATPMRRLRDGSFVATLDLPPGRHAYKLCVDGKEGWIADPGNPFAEPDGYGGENSLLFLAD